MSDDEMTREELASECRSLRERLKDAQSEGDAARSERDYYRDVLLAAAASAEFVNAAIARARRKVV